MIEDDVARLNNRINYLNSLISCTRVDLQRISNGSKPPQETIKWLTDKINLMEDERDAHIQTIEAIGRVML